MTITSYGTHAEIGRALDAATPKSNELAAVATIIDSRLPAGSSEDLSFLGMIPAMREWLGKRQGAIPVEYDYSIKNKKFETEVIIPLDWVENDKEGHKDRAVAQVPMRRNQLFGKLVADLLNAGESDNAFTGSTFFNASHSWNGYTIDNKVSATAFDGSDDALKAAQAILDAWEKFHDMTDDQGEPLNEGLSDLTVMCPVSVAAHYQLAISQNRLDTGTGVVDNPLNGVRAAGVNMKLIASKRITLSNKAVVTKSDPMAAPFVISHNARGDKVTAKTEGSDYEHDHDAWAYGIKAVCNGGYGLPSDAILITHS